VEMRRTNPGDEHCAAVSSDARAVGRNPGGVSVSSGNGWVLEYVNGAGVHEDYASADGKTWRERQHVPGTCRRTLLPERGDERVGRRERAGPIGFECSHELARSAAAARDETAKNERIEGPTRQDAFQILQPSPLVRNSERAAGWLAS